MSTTQFTRFKSDKPEEMVKTAKQAKMIFEKHGAEFLRISRFHTGAWAGEYDQNPCDKAGVPKKSVDHESAPSK